MLTICRDSIHWMHPLSLRSNLLDGWTAYGSQNHLTVHLETRPTESYSASDDIHQLAFNRTFCWSKSEQHVSCESWPLRMAWLSFLLRILFHLSNWHMST